MDFKYVYLKIFIFENYVFSILVKKGGNVINLRWVCWFWEVCGDKEVFYVLSKYIVVCINYFYGV